MARFFGRHEHSLDTKGRVILPVKFRAHFEPRAFLTQYRGPCLALWTPEEFERQMVNMEDSQSRSRDDLNLARLWASGTLDVEVDRQGRIAIPQYLRDFAGLEGEVLLTGAIDRVELWDPGTWDRKVRPSERRLVDDEED